MKYLKKLIVSMLAVVFIGLTTYQNLSRADEISDLKRKLEYLEAKKILETELQLLEAQTKNKKAEIQKLTSDYEDVLGADMEGEGAAQIDEVEPELEIEEVTTVKSETRVWKAANVRAPCGWRMRKETLEVSADGTFSFDAFNPTGGSWRCHYDGNLVDNTATSSSCGNNAKLDEFESVRTGENWDIKLKMKWPGGTCKISFTLN